METDFSYDNSQSEEKKSKYNSAIDHLYRIGALWKDAHSFSRQINYLKYNETLDRIWLELSADASKEDAEKIKKMDEKLMELKIYGTPSQLKIDYPTIYAKLIIAQKTLLMKKEEYLRLMLNKQGKGTAYEDTIEDYMD